MNIMYVISTGVQRLRQISLSLFYFSEVEVNVENEKKRRACALSSVFAKFGNLTDTTLA